MVLPHGGPSFSQHTPVLLPPLSPGSLICSTDVPLPEYPVYCILDEFHCRLRVARGKAFRAGYLAC